MVGFLNIYHELQRICHFCPTNLSFKHYIKIKLTLNHFSLFITMHDVLVFVDSNSTILVTSQNQTHLHMNFSLTMTNTTIS